MLQEISLSPASGRALAGGQRAGNPPPFVKGGKEGFSLQCPYNYGLINNYQKSNANPFH